MVLALAIGIAARQYCQAMRHETAYTTANLVRLHIVANSDDPSDQAIKIMVRDRVIDKFSPALSAARTAEDAERIIRDNLDLIEEEARQAVRSGGRSYGVRAVLGRFQFPPRVYGQMVLPEGEYRALRVVLGDGKGQNWWCVMFPPLCFVDAAQGNGPDVRAVAVEGPRPQRPQVKLLVAEWLKSRGSRVIYALGRFARGE